MANTATSGFSFRLAVLLVCVSWAMPAAGERAHQVDISVRVVEVNKDQLSDLGVNMRDLASLVPNVVVTTPSGNAGGRVLAEPRGTTGDNENVSFNLGGPIVSTGSPDPADFKFSLDIIPLIVSDGIRLQVDTSVSEFGRDGAAGVIGMTTRKQSTQVLVGYGQTAVIGGVLQQDANQLQSRIPGLSDIPTLGQLFASEKYQKGETDLVIFVTPELLGEDGRPVTGGGAPVPASGTPAEPKAPALDSLVYGQFAWYGVQSQGSERPDFALVTTTPLNFTSGSDNPATMRPFQGEITGPNTQILYDDDNADYSFANGFKGSVGAWFGRKSRFGLELNGFYVPEVSTSSSFSSGRDNNSFLSVPFNNTAGDFPYSVVIGSALTGQPASPGQIDIGSSLDFWGAGGALRVRGCNTCGVEFGLSLGFRYVQLNEEFSIGYQTDQTINTQFGQGTLGSLLFPNVQTQVGSRILAQDFVSAENDFYGLDLGVDATFEMLPNLFVKVAPRVALGANRQELTTSGWGNAWQPNGQMYATPYGLFARPGGVGTRSETNFAVAPEIDLEFRYVFTEWLSVTAGYNFFYLSDVVHAGNQLSNSIDAQINNNGAFQGMATSSGGRPFETDGFYANSVRMSVNLQF